MSIWKGCVGKITWGLFDCWYRWGFFLFFFFFPLESSGSSRCTHTEHEFRSDNFFFVKLEKCFITSVFYSMLILTSNTKMLMQNWSVNNAISIWFLTKFYKRHLGRSWSCISRAHWVHIESLLCWGTRRPSSILQNFTFHRSVFKSKQSQRSLRKSLPNEATSSVLLHRA